MSGRQAAARAGLSQSRLSRIERGAFMPTEAEVRALCELYGAPAKLRRGMVAVTRDIREEQASARVVLQRGAWRLQQRIGRIEQASGRIRSFHPLVVAGLLQTPAYMREVFRQAASNEDLDELVRTRTSRQQLVRSGRELTFLMPEGALRWNLGGPEVMVPQLEYLAEATAMPQVGIGIIPFSTTSPSPPLHGFHVYDSRAVIVGTLTATAIITDSRDVADYERQFAELERVASFGAAARDAINRVANDFRGMS